MVNLEEATALMNKPYLNFRAKTSVFFGAMCWIVLCTLMFSSNVFYLNIRYSPTYYTKYPLVNQLVSVDHPLRADRNLGVVEEIGGTGSQSINLNNDYEETYASETKYVKHKSRYIVSLIRGLMRRFRVQEPDIHVLKLNMSLVLSKLGNNNTRTVTGNLTHSSSNTTGTNKLTKERSSMNVIKRPGYLEVFKDYYYNFRKLPRPLDMKMHLNQMILLETFVRILDQLKVEYVMAYGTLLGSYFFHDLVPWDDDIDLSINFRFINLLRHVFARPEFAKHFGVASFHDPYDTYAPENLLYDIDFEEPLKCMGKIPAKLLRKDKPLKCYYKGKFFLKSSPDVFAKKKLPWRYPAIDFSFYRLFDDQVIMVEGIGKPLKMNAKYFYPLHMRPFHDMWLPSCHGPVEYLKAKFKQFKCQEGVYDHVHENTKPARSQHFLPSCDYIKTWYPYVKRKPVTVGNKSWTSELLVMGAKILYSVNVSEKYMHTRKLFEIS